MKNITAFLKRITAFSFELLIAAIICTVFPEQTAAAASVDYPPVLLRISTSDNSAHLNIEGTADKSAA